VAVSTLKTLLNKYEKATGEHDVEKLPTQLLPLDYVLDGGVPSGRVIEIYGENSTGKTTISTYMLSKFLEKDDDKAVVYIDAEYSFDPTWAKKNGIDVEKYLKEEKLFILYPKHLDEALEAIVDSVKSGEVSFILLDSLPALAPAELYEAEDPINFNRMGLNSKKETNFSKEVTPLLKKNNTTLLFINQIRANISPYGASTTVPGAFALKHLVSVRLETKRKDYVGTKENPEGIVTQIKCVKNKVGIPYRSENLIITSANGLSIEHSNVEFMVNSGIIPRSGAVYDVLGEKIRGKNAVAEYLSQNKEVYDELIKQTLEKFKEG
jgi:recombination protein RecA